MFTADETETECPLTRGLQIYNEVSELWIDHATNTGSYPWIDASSVDANYNFNVDTENYATYDNENIDPTVFKLRLFVTDPDSHTTNNIIYDEFDVTLKYECDDDILTLGSPTDYNLREYQLDSGSHTITENVDQTIVGCTILSTAEVFDDDL